MAIDDDEATPAAAIAAAWEIPSFCWNVGVA